MRKSLFGTMPQSPEQTAPAATAPADFVERRVRLMAILGILLTSSVIGGIATALLYKSQANSLTSQLFFAIELQTAAMEAELARLNNIATQITSRTQIRLQLERFQRGEISQQMLIDFTVPKLTDAISSDNGILGVTRLSPQLQPLIEVGQPIPVSLWPKRPSNTATALGIPRDDLLVVSAPIRNRSMQTVGIDLVMFRDDRLRNIMQGFFDHIETSGSIQVATLQDGIAVHFYDIGHKERPLSSEELRSELIEQLQLGYDEGLHSPDSRHGGNFTMAHHRIGTSDWVMMFYADPGDFFRSARTHAAFAAFTVLILAMLGIALTNRVIRPLVDRVATEARGLQRLLQQNEELLDAVQANESKLQAVIDNAPAVIYIKDPSGQYLLVNSSYERLVEMPREQIVGKYDYQLFPESIAKSTRDTDLEVLASGRSIAVDERAPHRDGMHDYLSTKFPLFDTRGQANAVCGISTDITERKRVERRLALTQHTVDRANVGVLWADPAGQLLYLNDAATQLLRFNDRELPHLNLADVTTSLDAAAWKAHWESVKRLGSLHYETRYQRSDHETFPVEVHANHLAFDEQEFYIAIVHDISNRHESERRLRQSATVFECSAEAIVITDTQGTVIDVNPAFSRILGYSREQVIGRKPSLWKSELYDETFYRAMWTSIIDTGQWRGEIINRNRDGSVTPELVAINTVYNEYGEPASYVAIYTDISQIKESQGQLAHMAHHDPLTNLPNRILFHERLQHALDRASRRDGSVAVIFVDLDHFKHVNDSLGHSYGDRLLIEVAEVLSSRLRHEDTVARIGGDEFTILIEEVSDRNRLTSVIEKIIEAFDREFVLGDSTIRVTPSLGISISPNDGMEAETLMRNADAAMYRAKSLGRNTYEFYTEELTALATRRIHIDGALRKAIQDAEFHLAYQPQIDLTTGRIVGMEALVRWNSPLLGPMPPEQFLPIAEDSGLILPLGEWILSEACRQAREWLDAGILPGTLAVNISGVQVRRGDLVDVVRRVLQDSGLPSDKLELELTESFIMGESQNAIRILQDLRDLGVTLAVDDFGTGYSSLAYLKSLPIHLLKIDKSFIRDIPEDTNDMAITRAVIALAKSLNLGLVGEGVETEIQRRFLLEEGCQFGQGFLFHRPLPAIEMQALLFAQQSAPAPH